MIQQDYILKQIEELGKVIADLISMRQVGDTNRKIEIINRYYEMIGLNKINVESKSVAEIINYVSNKEKRHYLEVLESISNIIFEESFIISDTNNKQELLKKSYELMNYVNENSNSFSFQRQQKISEIINQIQN